MQAAFSRFLLVPYKVSLSGCNIWAIISFGSTYNVTIWLVEGSEDVVTCLCTRKISSQQRIYSSFRTS